jgi:hypothetical protein
VLNSKDGEALVRELREEFLDGRLVQPTDTQIDIVRRAAQRDMLVYIDLLKTGAFIDGGE